MAGKTEIQSKLITFSRWQSKNVIKIEMMSECPDIPQTPRYLLNFLIESLVIQMTVSLWLAWAMMTAVSLGRPGPQHFSIPWCCIHFHWFLMHWGTGCVIALKSSRAYIPKYACVTLLGWAKLSVSAPCKVHFASIFISSLCWSQEDWS